jgi:transposase
LIFDLDSDLPYKSPWYNALQCWWKSLKNSVRFNLQFKTSTKDDASPGEFFSELKRTFDDWKNSFSVV